MMRMIAGLVVAFLLIAKFARSEEFELSHELYGEPALSGDSVFQCSARRHGPKTLFCWRGAPAPEGGDEDIATDRPDFTEASSTVGLGRLQLETGYTYVLDDSAGIRTESHSFPESLFRVGILAEWLELRVGWNYADEVRRSTVAERLGGGEDMYLGFKLALTEQQGCLPEMALMPQMSVPTGGDDFTAERVLPGLNWLYGWDLSERLAFGGSTQGNGAVDETGAGYSEFAQSLTTAYSLSDRIGVYGEWFAFFPHGAEEPGLGAEHYVNGGFTYLVNPDLQFDVRAGYGLNERADDFFAGVGAAFRY